MNNELAKKNVNHRSMLDIQARELASSGISINLNDCCIQCA